MEKQLKQIDLLRAKLEFFAFTAAELEPFPREFQSNQPIVPFLYDRLQSIFSSLMGWLMKAHVLEAAKNGVELVRFDP